MKDKLLDRFLFEVKRDAERANGKKVAETVSLPEVSIYANPDNWYCTRVIELICRTLDGATEESLGLFQEERHRISPSARRLRPWNGGDMAVLPGAYVPGLRSDFVPSVQEKVSGAHWLYTKQPPKVEDTPYEIEALKKLFEELIGEA